MDACQIQPGTLKHSITIQEPSTVRDSAGQLNASWTPLLTIRAAILSTASNSFRFSFSGNALASNATDLIQIRYPGEAVSIVPGQQVTFGDQVYEITATDNVQRRNRVLNLAVVGLDTGSV
jgi:SPP1 family predicted phage head-tail adaptor